TADADVESGIEGACVGTNCPQGVGEYPVYPEIVQTGTGQDMNLTSARGTSPRLRSCRNEDNHRTTGGGRDMRGAGVVADGEDGRAGKIDQGGQFGAPDEIDRHLASRADFDCEGLLAPDADDDREGARSLEQPLGHTSWPASALPDGATTI